MNRIKDLRIDRDLSQKTVASAIGTTQRKYSYLETGIQLWTEDLLLKLAEFYDTSVDYLLGKTDVKTAYPNAKRKP